jgi:uncharacterized protein YjiS (DUF1127 family)
MSMNWTVPFAAQSKTEDPWMRRVLAAASRRWSAYCRWRAEQIAIGQLSAMSDRELRDIGLIRSEIDRAVIISPFAAARLGGHDTPRTKWRGVNPSIR